MGGRSVIYVEVGCGFCRFCHYKLVMGDRVSLSYLAIMKRERGRCIGPSSRKRVMIVIS